MNNTLYIPLENRSIISISGADAKTFLQGLITNDMKKVSPKEAIYALMLTPQGKFLYDFFIIQKDDAFFVDCSKSKLPEIIKKLSMYKLRSDVQITDISNDYVAISILDNNSSELPKDAIVYKDPRSEKMGLRAICKPERISHDYSIYESTRINACIPAADVDMLSGDAFPLNFNMNELNAIDYKKGCYVGQEVTARMNYRGNIKKKLYVAKLTNEVPFPAIGEPVTANGENIGTLLSSTNSAALCILIIEKVENSKNLYRVGNSEIIIQE
jgi:folate-binding protein YgfZ